MQATDDPGWSGELLAQAAMRLAQTEFDIRADAFLSMIARLLPPLASVWRRLGPPGALIEFMLDQERYILPAGDLLRWTTPDGGVTRAGYVEVERIVATRAKKEAR